MVLAVAIVGGFKQEIREKLTGFSAHVQISRFDRNFSYETTPYLPDPAADKAIRETEGIRHLQHFATKAGILKKGTSLQGVVAKGVAANYDWTFFSGCLREGRLPDYSQNSSYGEILLSESVARKLDLHAGDSIVMYFIQQPPRVRKFHVCGIYSTGFEEFDKLYLFCDIGQIRKLNDWGPGEVGGTELYVYDFNRLEELTEKVYANIGSDLNARSIRELYPQLFDWLELQDINAMIIIALMIIVCGINMISALLVIQLERIPMIGTLKAIGSTDGLIRQIFLQVAVRIVFRGLLIGNAIGIALASAQQHFEFMPLDQASYYIDHVPIRIELSSLLAINAFTMIACTAMLILPTLLIGRIRPVNALRYS
ncbi:MAG: hypothetical protein RL021_478 [Bacteroidota bacterium]